LPSSRIFACARPRGRLATRFLRGFFAAIEANGEAQFFGVEFIGADFNSVNPPIGVPFILTDAIQFVPFGQPEVVQEFIAGQSERAIAEAASWARELKKHRAIDRDWLTAARYVDLAIALDSTGMVGGNTEVAELTPQTGFVWKRNPGQCPSN
jgi:hypothetical protein